MDDYEPERRARFDREVRRVLEEAKNGDSLEGGFGKWRLRVKGEKVMGILFVTACSGFIGYLVYQHDHDSKETLADMRRVIIEAREAQEAMIYVISLPQAEREKLNLARPKKLSDMQR